MSSSQVISPLKKVLADSYSLYLKTQNYHWNVEGSNFPGLHALFEGQYTDLASAVDEIAELIRSLGEKAPGTFSEFSALSSIEDGNANASAEAMLKDLASDQETITNGLQAALEVAQEVGDEVVIGALVDRMTVHRKNRWMLMSSLA